MTDHFSTDDPRGRTIICTERNWGNHIEKRHSDLVSYETETLETISRPDFIFKDTDFSTREVYYLKYAEKKMFLKVVVQFTSPKIGEVVTAYFVAGIKTGEKQIWSK
jgi:hypothetical protein